MLKGYQILDADCHVLEPVEMWQEYLEPAFKKYAPEADRAGIKIAGHPIYHKLSDRVQTEAYRQTVRNHLRSVVKGFDASSQVEAMQKMGVDITFLYPTVGLCMLAIDTMERQLAGALTRAYNNWLRDFCNYQPDMLNPVGAINMHDPAEMVPELQRVAAWGWKTVFLRPNPVKGRLLSDPAYEPFWSECELRGIAVSIHEGSHSRLPTTGADRFSSRFALHACSHPMELMMAMLALIEGGVLERHPNLKVAFLEAGCGWLPYWLWRLDMEYENLAWEVQEHVKMKPSEYFRRQCFIAVEPSEPYLNQIIDYIGTDNLLFGSDYPHMDHQPDIVTEAVSLSDRLSSKTLQKILWDNPLAFYGLS